MLQSQSSIFYPSMASMRMSPSLMNIYLRRHCGGSSAKMWAGIWRACPAAR